MEIVDNNVAPFLCSNAYWHDDIWRSAQPCGPQRNGQHGGHGEARRNIKEFIKSTTKELRDVLVRAASTELATRIIERGTIEPHSKTTALASQLSSSGPSLAIALDWVGPTCHVTAVSALFSGDFFLGRYAGNYFAKQLLPTSPKHLEALDSENIEASRVCLYCWHNRRQPILECEAHIVAECPLYNAQRRDLTLEVSSQLASLWHAADSPGDKLKLVIGAPEPRDWQAFGRFLARVRQVRTRLRADMQKLCELRSRREFHAAKNKWRREGRHVCRHGVFFDSPPAACCPCLAPSSDADWIHAVLMPALDPALKCIATDTFKRHEYQRLGVLQAEARRRDYF